MYTIDCTDISKLYSLQIIIIIRISRAHIAHRIRMNHL